MSTVYNRGKARIATVGWPNLDVRALVLADADTLPAGTASPDLNTVAELLAVSGTTEAAGSGYARQTITGEAVVENDAGDSADLDANDIAWPANDSGRWVAVVFYEEGASDAARNLLGLFDITPLTTNGGAVNTPVDANGLFGLT